MKIRIKKTGEILEDVKCIDTTLSTITIQYLDDGILRETRIKNLSDIEEICEETEYYWFIDELGDVVSAVYQTDDFNRDLLAIGNHFETAEEAEKAVKKLEAWKRLKDKGFRPKMWEWEYIYDDNISGELIIKAHIDDATDSDGKYTKDLDLLFGGEDE